MREAKMLLDTDIGSDVDDAVCLAYLLAQPRCDLLGITTVGGEADKRAMLASALCKMAARDVPILPGTELPLLGPQRQPTAQQAEALGTWEHDTEFPRGDAVEFMRRTIREHPGEIDLLAVGPLTNVALLFSVDPEVPLLLKSLVLMCGAFTVRPLLFRGAEWNARCDPHAAAIVYRAPVANHRSVGLDVTQQVRMESSEVRDRFRDGLLRPVLDFAEVWFRQSEILTFHDPLAAVTLFDPDVCAFETGDIEAETLSQHVPGMTHWTPNDTGAHEVALSVDSERFFEHYLSTLAGHSPG